MKSILLVSAIAALVGGCATVTRGTTDQIQITSEPAGARVTTSLAHSCVAPCTIQVSRKDEFTVSFEKEGFQRQDVPVKTQLAGNGAAGFAGNILLGGIVGMGVDAATGATLEHVPNPVKAVLVPLEQPKVQKPTRRHRLHKKIIPAA
jgi:hypothetical protein